MVSVEYYIEIANVSDDNKKNELEALQNNSNYTNQAATVYIDTNGSASPNVYGRDLFSFDLGVDGRLYPFGGHDYNFYHGVSSTNLEEGCKNGNGAFCAAYLMNNNYEMDY